MPKCIIVEGPDGAGKTTLLARLSSDLGRPVYHTGGPPANLEHLEVKLALVAEHSDHFLFDRVPHISEPIYSKATGKETYIPEPRLHDLLEELNPVVVYCRLSSLSTMFESVDREKKPHKPTEHLEDVLRNYKAVVEDYDATMEKLSAKPGISVLKYSWEDDSYPALLEQIKCAG